MPALPPQSRGAFCTAAFLSAHNMYDRGMENSAHIQPPLTSLDIHAFAMGYGSGTTGGPVQIAWQLENAALDMGWPIEHSMGSEADFIDRYAANRDIVRSAIRLLEARGLMRMRRGRQGGLRLLRPDIDHVAGAFAAYLHASGYSQEKLNVLVRVFASLQSKWSGDALIRQLWDRVLVMSSHDFPAGPIEGARAEVVAMRLLRELGRSIPEDGVPLGCEAELCEKFGMGHRTFRQAVGILDDLGMSEAKRGRGGGYRLKRPAAIGVIRRLFALIASRGMKAEDVEPIVWTLCIANLRLVFVRMIALDAHQRAKLCDGVTMALRDLVGMQRWVTFQKELARIADDLLLSTTISSMLAYLGRVRARSSSQDEFDTRLLDVEQAILKAMRAGAAGDAEHHFLTAQTYMQKYRNHS